MAQDATAGGTLRTSFVHWDQGDHVFAQYVTCALRLASIEGERTFFAYRPLTVSISPRQTVLAVFKRAGKELLASLLTDQQLNEIEAACRVQIDDPKEYTWDRDSRVAVVKHRNTVREPINLLNEKHRGQVKQEFGTFAQTGARDMCAALKSVFSKVAKHAEQIIEGHLTRLMRCAANEEIRKKQKRENGAYENPENICRYIFKGWRAASGNEPVVEGNLFATPPFYAQRINADVAVDGDVSFLLTFGVDPYTYAVVLVARMERLGKATLSRDLKVYALADFGGKKVVKRIDAAPGMDEAQLEMAVLLAVGGAIPSPASAEA